MNIVSAPLQIGAVRPAVTAMQWGQHAIAVALTVIGAFRAVADGVPVFAAMAAGAGIIGWNFLGSFATFKQVTAHTVTWWFFGLALVWLAAVWVSPEFVWVAFLLWLLAGHLLQIWWAIFCSLLIYGVVVFAPVVQQGTTSFANIAGPLIGGVFAFGISRGYLELLKDATERERLVKSLRDTQQERQHLQDELALAQRHSGMISERTRLAREIHDTVAQSLSSIRLLALAATRESSGPDDAQTEQFEQIEELSTSGLSEVRRIVAALAPGALDATSLTDALAAILVRLNNEAGILTELHVDDTLPTLTAEIEVALLRTAQSALANVRQHAKANLIVVSVIDDGNEVRLDLIDDGIGFDVAEWENTEPVSHTDASGYGLWFMRSRLRELGGGLVIEAAPGEGTALSAHLPLHAVQQRKDAT